MSKPWMKFYPSDWQADPLLRACSLAARGLLIELLCLMHKSEWRGYLLVNGVRPTEIQLKQLVGCSAQTVRCCRDELLKNGVLSQTENSTLFSRRMVRDTEKQEVDRVNGSKGGNPALMQSVNPVNGKTVNPPLKVVGARALASSLFFSLSSTIPLSEEATKERKKEDIALGDALGDDDATAAWRAFE